MTENSRLSVDIEVESRYLAEHSDSAQGIHSFAYTVTITNRSAIGVQLISRCWNITDGEGEQHEVRGLGVVGHQPLIPPGERFQYTSGCQLPTPSGRMSGSYFFVSEQADRFEAAIPSFSLEMPRTLH